MTNVKTLIMCCKNFGVNKKYIQMDINFTKSRYKFYKFFDIKQIYKIYIHIKFISKYPKIYNNRGYIFNNYFDIKFIS